MKVASTDLIGFVYGWGWKAGPSYGGLHHGDFPVREFS